MTTSLSTRVKALRVLKAQGHPFGRYLGTHGGNHVFQDKAGRLLGVDLVIEEVCLYVGIPPRIEKAW